MYMNTPNVYVYEYTCILIHYQMFFVETLKIRFCASYYERDYPKILAFLVKISAHIRESEIRKNIRSREESGEMHALGKEKFLQALLACNKAAIKSLFEK